MTFDEDAARARLETQRDELARRVERLQAAEQEETARSGNVGGETDNAHEWENAERLELIPEAVRCAKHA